MERLLCTSRLEVVVGRKESRLTTIGDEDKDIVVSEEV